MTVSSGQKVTSSSIDAIPGLMLSSSFTQRQFQGAGGTITFAASGSGTTFIAPTTSCAVTITSAGTEALIFIAALLAEDTAGHIGRGAVEISGATTTTASTTGEFFLHTTSATANRYSMVGMMPISPGANTYTLKYLSASTASTLTVTSQSILVIAP